jgi:hypothetical protein
LSTITAKAEDPAGVSLPNALVRARDARYGRIVATLVTNKAGNVVFEGLDPGFKWWKSSLPPVRSWPPVV